MKTERIYMLQVSEEEMAEYSAFFKAMRKSIGFNLEQMGEALGVFRTTVSRWEKGIIPNRDIDEIVQEYRRVVRLHKKLAG
jgi:transcriptional regulator with XRE-family HTH domain